MPGYNSNEIVIFLDGCRGNYRRAAALYGDNAEACDFRVS